MEVVERKKKTNNSIPLTVKRQERLSEVVGVGLKSIDRYNSTGEKTDHRCLANQNDDEN